MTTRFGSGSSYMLSYVIRSKGIRLAECQYSKCLLALLLALEMVVAASACATRVDW